MERLHTLFFTLTTGFAIAASALQGTLQERKNTANQEKSFATIARGIESSVQDSYKARNSEQILRIARNLVAKGQISAMALCVQEHGKIQGKSQRKPRALGFPEKMGWIYFCGLSTLGESRLLTLGDRGIGLYIHPLHGVSSERQSVSLALIHDTASSGQSPLAASIKSFLIFWSLGLGALAVTVAPLRRRMGRTLRSLISKTHLTYTVPSKRSTRQTSPPAVPRTFSNAFSWINSLRESIEDRTVVIVANREPYIHHRRNEKIEIVRPASGLVTALEPILRYSGGLWIAHGSGSADRDTSNANGEIAVPPDRPRYTLKRIWLTEEEEQGYYYGFANEGLWPLCHLAHTRPIFRLKDWNHYQVVNRKFSDEIPTAVLDGRTLFLIQDYHFALVPGMVRQRWQELGAKEDERPKSGLFWHIPWPNPEAFGICPWNKELLRGMLGASVIGFHTQYHCNNFLETCDRYLEARIDWEDFSVTMEDHETLVRPFPIGIDTTPIRSLSPSEREALKARYGIHAEIVIVGVDRLDYTKGLLERIEAFERFLEKNPSYVGRLTLAQMGSPSRIHIPAYQSLVKDVVQAVERVNNRFKASSSDSETGGEGYRPIVLLASHHEWEEIKYFYQLGEICMVTSLHDGMNLVAKEYVWCQAPERGSLILSKFTGASRELTEAFIVNPYAIEEMADAIAMALELSPEEKAKRMRSMKDKIESHNAFHWATDLIRALATPSPSRAP